MKKLQFGPRLAEQALGGAQLRGDEPRVQQALVSAVAVVDVVPQLDERGAVSSSST